MSGSQEDLPSADVDALLDRLAADASVQDNCMFQLALMLARVAVEPCSEAYKGEAAQALVGLIRAKPKSNVVQLFARSPRDRDPETSWQAAG